MPPQYAVKCKLIRLLHARKWDATLIRQFFRVIDWMMVLPPELAEKLSHYIMVLEEEKKMEYVSTVERYIMEKKHQEGSHSALSATLCRLLSRRFGELPQATQTLVQNASTAQIDDWIDRVMDAPTLDDVFQDLPH